MKFPAVGLFVGALSCVSYGSLAFAQTPPPPPDMTQGAVAAQPVAQLPATPPPAPAIAGSEQARENDAAGLPDLDKINRPAAVVSSHVELNTVREPSFHTRDRDGTEVTEYRDRGKPTEIDVRSNFGTRYQMSTPFDNSPQVPSNGAPNGRVPTIKLSY
jgi:hypothetical protein